MKVRAETRHDHEPVHALNAAAFESDAEADLVDTLRTEANPVISLVAEVDGAAVGHILFSPVTLTGHEDRLWLALAPMAVRPEVQRRGIGSALVRAGLERCRELSAAAVVVLGHPRFYPKFGFVPSTRYAIRSDYNVPEEVFMILELEEGALTGVSGTVKYHPAFADLS